MPEHCEPPKCLKSKDIAAKDAKNRVVRGRERPALPGCSWRHRPRSSLPPTYYQRPEPVQERYRASTGIGRERGPKEDHREQTKN